MHGAMQQPKREKDPGGDQIRGVDLLNRVQIEKDYIEDCRQLEKVL
jgi:hypothetical protein